MDKNTYQVIITNKLSDKKNKKLVIQDLAKLFKIDIKQAERLISQPTTIVKRNTDEDTARKFLASIMITGADCKIVNISQETHTYEAKEKLELDDINEINNDDGPKNLCPKCGSIKNLRSDECVFCGFNYNEPEKKSYKGLKHASIVIILLTILAAAAYQFGLPFYNSYSNDKKIESGLQLAFETRNKVSQFILKTNFWPNQNIDANLDKNISNEIIESIIISENALMTVTLRAEALGTEVSKTIIFKPRFSKGKLIWNCTKGTLDNELRPRNCKNIQLEARSES